MTFFLCCMSCIVVPGWIWLRRGSHTDERQLPKSSRILPECAVAPVLVTAGWIWARQLTVCRSTGQNSKGCSRINKWKFKGGSSDSKFKAVRNSRFPFSSAQSPNRKISCAVRSFCLLTSQFAHMSWIRCSQWRFLLRSVECTWSAACRFKLRLLTTSLLHHYRHVPEVKIQGLVVGSETGWKGLDEQFFPLNNRQLKKPNSISQRQLSLPDLQESGQDPAWPAVRASHATGQSIWKGNKAALGITAWGGRACVLMDTYWDCRESSGTVGHTGYAGPEALPDAR